MINGFALNQDKSLQIYLFCLKHRAKNDISERCRKHSSKSSQHQKIKQFFFALFLACLGPISDKRKFLKFATNLQSDKAFLLILRNMWFM